MWIYARFGCDCTNSVNLKQRKINQSQKLCLVAEKITEKHKEGRERERERTYEELRTCEEPREMWAMKESRSESESERAPFGNIYLLNVLNSLSLKWAFIQCSVIVFQRFTTVDKKINLFYPQLIKLLINRFSLLTPFTTMLEEKN